MGLFDDLPRYGGTFTRRFNQNQLIDEVIRHRFQRSEHLATGACAALCLDWLEFKMKNLGNDLPYNNERLQQHNVIGSIIQIQTYLRLRDIELSEFISNFGTEKQKDGQSYMDFINTLDIGIHVIHLENQNPDGTNANHVAVCLCSIKNGKLNIELFDAMRGDAKFSLDEQNASRAKQWLNAYFSSYERHDYAINVVPFSLEWRNSCSSVAKMCKFSNDTILSPALPQNPYGFWNHNAGESGQSPAATTSNAFQH